MMTPEYHTPKISQQKKPIQLHLNSLLATFKDRLPHRPYCTNDFSQGLRIRPAEQALEYLYIQHNPPVCRAWLTYDIDRPGAIYAAQDAGLPHPSMLVESPGNRHAHLSYGLTFPIYTARPDTTKQMRWAASLDILIAEKLGADRNYSGLTTKNPAHNDWITYPGRPGLYDLAELSEYVDFNDLAKLRDARRRLPSIGLGRNCNLFDDLRRWAYKRVDEYRGTATLTVWKKVVFAQAQTYNHFEGMEKGPLFQNEVYNTAKSVAVWTWENYFGRMPNEQFSKVQANRVARRWGQSPKDAVVKLKLWDESKTTSQLAELVSRSERHVRRFVSQERTEYEATAQARADRVAELRQQGLKWKAIGQQLGVSPGAAKMIFHRKKGNR